VEAHFDTDIGESPLKIFKDPFSRYTFVIIENRDAVTCNVHLEDLEAMRLNANYAYEKYMDSKSITMSMTDGGASPAFTVQFTMGDLKGKTPAQVLSENGYEAGKEILNKQYAFLKKNVEKYKANQKVLDAIKDAAKLNPDELKKEKISARSSVITLYDLPVRPLIRRQRED
jgi:hypothetical protein